jgi:ABC-2 type transport system ATP-binding protein
MISFKNFKKNYGDINVLHIEALNIPDGAHWVRGENGSGKTTLFKSLAGLLPFDGDILFDNTISAKLNPVSFRRIVNYGEAEPMYPSFITGKDLIRFIGKAKGATMAQQNDMTDQFGIGSFINKSCQTYSSGMLKKISLVLAFLGNPKLIILDEPLITLDDQARNLLIHQLHLHVERGVNFLISSHQLMEHWASTINNTYVVQNKTLIAT